MLHGNSCPSADPTHRSMTILPQIEDCVVDPGVEVATVTWLEISRSGLKRDVQPAAIKALFSTFIASLAGDHYTAVQGLD